MSGPFAQEFFVDLLNPRRRKLRAQEGYDATMGLPLPPDGESGCFCLQCRFAEGEQRCDNCPKRSRDPKGEPYRPPSISESPSRLRWLLRKGRS